MRSAVRYSGSRQERILALASELASIESELESLAAGEIDAIIEPGSTAPILLRSARQALARSETRFRNLVARCPAIVCELAADGTTLFVNSAVQTVLGYSPAEIMGRNWWSFLVADQHASGNASLNAAWQSGDLHAHEVAVAHSDGSTRWISWTSTRLDTDHHQGSTILFGVDVTQHKMAEHNARELHVARLARHTAEAANLSKSQFLAVMSHELRTPLNAISGYAELIEMGLRGPVTEAQIVDLQKIRRSKEHLLSLINDILSFARIEAGNMQLDIKEILVEEVIHTVQSMVEPISKEKHITLEVPHRLGNVVAFADRERTQQILTNLVCNALKFTPPRGRVELRCHLNGNSTVVFEVQDTGVGIPPDKLESVFEPFVQLQHGPQSRNDGIGLGLYISKSLALAMGGSLEARSRPGEGSVFTLTLPAGTATTRGLG